MESTEKYGINGISVTYWSANHYIAKMPEHFGNFIRWKRARLGLNKRQFAQKLGVDPKTVTNLERRESPYGTDDVTIARIAEAFAVPELEIFEWYKLWPEQQQSKTYDLHIPVQKQQTISQRAAESDVSSSEWIALAIESVLAVEDWKPGMALAVKPVKMVETGRPQRDAAKKKPEK